mmetsp:Transcript_3046/g.5848  ORF Transcript_3046/g.5848 Transcript_3046/m.5848 type:complete len:219 (-) Transcript_3046:172-828(-)
MPQYPNSVAENRGESKRGSYISMSSSGISRIAFLRPTVAIGLSRASKSISPRRRASTNMVSSLHEIQGVRDLGGNEVNFQEYLGKVVLAVNVACQCGYTQSGYQTMKNLADRFDESKFAVLAFPSNDFGRQEPGSPEEISAFVSSRFGNPKIRLMEKSEVKGREANPVFAFAKASGLGEPSWNFDGRILFDKTGKAVERFNNGTSESELASKIQTYIG